MPEPSFTYEGDDPREFTYPLDTVETPVYPSATTYPYITLYPTTGLHVEDQPDFTYWVLAP